MGRSTSAQLIAKGKGENSYNNSGISTDVQWVDLFNDALEDLVYDLNIQETLPPVNFVTTTREYDLPADYFGIQCLYDASGCEVTERRSYNQHYPCGYRILNKGSKYVIDLYRMGSDQIFTGQYIRYAALLTSGGADSERPEIPSTGEKALYYYAIAKALRNNNQPVGDYEKLYERERLKIRNAVAQSRGG